MKSNGNVLITDYHVAISIYNYRFDSMHLIFKNFIFTDGLVLDLAVAGSLLGGIILTLAIVFVYKR